jgi:hypothetical protein
VEALAGGGGLVSCSAGCVLVGVWGLDLLERTHVMWTLESGLAQVRLIQQPIRAFGYHVAIGGGVVNAGQSNKDLDLYFLPMPLPNANGLRTYLTQLWGPAYCLGGGPDGAGFVRPADVNFAYPPDPVWVNGRFTYRPADRRIDIFIA